MVGDPDSIDRMHICQLNIVRTHDTLEDYFELGVGLDPFDVLPCDFIVKGVHKGFVMIFLVGVLDVLSELFEDL